MTHIHIGWTLFSPELSLQKGKGKIGYSNLCGVQLPVLLMASSGGQGNSHCPTTACLKAQWKDSPRKCCHGRTSCYIDATVMCHVKAPALPHELGTMLELLSAVSQLLSACVTSPWGFPMTHKGSQVPTQCRNQLPSLPGMPGCGIQ